MECVSVLYVILPSLQHVCLIVSVSHVHLCTVLQTPLRYPSRMCIISPFLSTLSLVFFNILFHSAHFNSILVIMSTMIQSCVLCMWLYLTDIPSLSTIPIAVPYFPLIFSFFIVSNLLRNSVLSALTLLLD